MWKTDWMVFEIMDCLVQFTIIIIIHLAPFWRVAVLAANNLQSVLSSASSVASSTLRLCGDRLFFIVASQAV